MGSQEFCLRWGDHRSQLLADLDALLQEEVLVDVTLTCEGRSLKAHKMVLSACSPLLRRLLADGGPHPIVILAGVPFADLQALIRFMYKGEVNVSQDQLPRFLSTAEALEVRGLAQMATGCPQPPLPAPSSKRKRHRRRSGSSSGSCDNAVKSEVLPLEEPTADVDTAPVAPDSPRNQEPVIEMQTDQLSRESSDEVTWIPDHQVSKVSESSGSDNVHEAYVKSLYPSVKESQLNIAATDKCVQIKRRLGFFKRIGSSDMV